MSIFKKFFQQPTVEQLETSKDVSSLVKILAKADDTASRNAAARALANIKSESSVPALIAALDTDSDWRVRREAALALGKIGDSRAIQSLIHHLDDDEGLRELSDELSRENRALRMGGSDAWGPYDPPTVSIEEKFRSDPLVSHCCVKALYQIGNAARDPLLDCISHDGNWGKLNRAADILCSIDREAMIEPFIALLQQGSETQKCVAARALGDVNQPRAAEALLTSVEQELARTVPSRLVLTDLCSALSKYHNVRAIPLLIRVLKYIKTNSELGADKIMEELIRFDNQAANTLVPQIDHPNEQYRDAVAEILLKIADRSTVKPLLGRLSSDSADTRMCAANILGAIGDPEALDSLVLLLKDQKPRVRRSAAEALGKLGDLRCLNSLEALLNDPKHAVRQAALDAIEILKSNARDAAKRSYIPFGE